MSVRRNVFVFTAVVLVSSCQAQTTTLPPNLKENCSAQKIAPYIGQSKTALSALALEGPLRLLPPKSPMTLDFRPTRTNVELDKDGRIVKAWCG